MNFVGGDTNFCAQAKFKAIGKRVEAFFTITLALSTKRKKVWAWL